LDSLAVKLLDGEHWTVAVVEVQKLVLLLVVVSWGWKYFQEERI
jgi:hypothetical protein